ncbi:hypothetical protein ACFFRR_010560 [Megaselia abdita]
MIKCIFKFLIIIIAFHQSIGFTCVKDLEATQLVSASSGHIPSGAVYGGVDRGRSIFLCIASAQSKTGDLVGKLAETLSDCIYGEAGKEFYISDYKVPVNLDGVWVPVFPPELPCNAIPFGTFKEAMYAGRIHIDNTITTGSVIKGVAYIPYGGRTDTIYSNYEIFTAVSKKLSLNKGNSNRFPTIGKYLTFKLKADDEVAIYFGIKKVNHFVVTLGAKNSMSIGTIYYPFYTNTRAPSDLNENVHKGYWIRWTNAEYLEFGREGDIFPILTLKDEMVSKIDSVLFASPNGASEWILPEL